MRSPYTRDPWYSGTKFDPNKDHLFSQLNTASHDKLKAKALHGYNGRDNVDLEDGVNLMVTHLLDVIRNRHLSTSDGARPVDFAILARYFTLDVITLLGFGERFGFLDSEYDLYGYTTSVDRAITLLTLAADLPLLRRVFTSSILSWLLLAPQRTDKQGFGKIMG